MNEVKENSSEQTVKLQLNSLKPAVGSKKSAKRVGRGIGSGFGKTAGRGHKGQKSRSGGKVRPGFEGGQMPLQRRVPKFGFTSRIGRLTAEVRLSELNKITDQQIDLDTLKKFGIVNKSMKRAKVMLAGELDKSVNLKGIAVTKGARAAIEAKGGTIEQE